MPFLFHYEILANLGSIQISLSFPEYVRASAVHVSNRFGAPNVQNHPEQLKKRPYSYTIKPDAIVISWGEEGFYNLALPCKVLPRSVQSFEIHPGLAVELKLNFDPTEFEAFKKTLLTKDIIVEKRECRNLSCRFCEAIQLKGNSIHRVFDLPSDTWFEVIENCSCHPDHFATTHPHEGAINAKPGAILVAPNFYQVHAVDVLSGTYSIEEMGSSGIQSGEWIKISCSSCQYPFGKALFQGTDLGSLTSIKYNTFSVTTDENNRHRTISQHLAAEITRKAKEDASYRFILRSSQSGKLYAAIWVLNLETWIATNIPRQGPMNFDISSDQSELIQDHRPRLIPVLKVLYHDLKNGLELEKTLGLWKGKEGVEEMQLLEDDCLNVAADLRSATNILSPPKRVFNGFLVGYIMK